MTPNQPHSNTTRSDDSDIDVLNYVAKQESKRQKIEKEEDKNNDIRIINETPEPSDTGNTSSSLPPSLTHSLPLVQVLLNVRRKRKWL